MIAVGLIGGFAMLFRDPNGPTVTMLSLVPYGFLILLAGAVACPLKDGKKSTKPDESGE
ncbi:MAG: hypothetical protein P8180_15330 [Gammaproteobacteria bacterium]|jgi:hypothetical protein